MSSALVICSKGSNDFHQDPPERFSARQTLTSVVLGRCRFSELASDVRNVLSLTTVSENFHFLPEKGREVSGPLSWVVDLQHGDQGYFLPMRREDNVVMLEGAAHKDSLVCLVGVVGGRTDRNTTTIVVT